MPEHVLERRLTERIRQALGADPRLVADRPALPVAAPRVADTAPVPARILRPEPQVEQPPVPHHAADLKPLVVPASPGAGRHANAAARVSA